MDSTTSSTASGPRRLVRITADEKVAGVCAGIADYLDVVGGLLVYLAAWFIVPKAPTVIIHQQPQAA